MDVLSMTVRAAAQNWRRIVSPLLAVPLLACPAFAATENPSLEYAVKAAYLSKLALFVNWPEAAFSSPTSPINLCVAGADPFGDALDKIVEGARIGGRAIMVRRIAAVTRDTACHILYVGGSGTQSVAQALDAVRGSGVLTVTDSARRGGTAGAIDFVVANARVRFNVDDQVAAMNGLTISSHLLSLALSVKPRGG